MCNQTWNCVCKRLINIDRRLSCLQKRLDKLIRYKRLGAIMTTAKPQWLRQQIRLPPLGLLILLYQCFLKGESRLIRA